MPLNTNTNVGPARHELTPCANSKTVDDRKRTYLQVIQKRGYWKVESAPTRAYVVSRE